MAKNTTRSGKVTFRMPTELKNPATKRVISSFAAELEEQGRLTATTLPYLYQLAYLHELNANLMTDIVINGVTQINAKGEMVKRAEVTAQKDFWNQYLAIAKELGLTIKSKAQIDAKGSNESGVYKPPIEEFI